MKKLLTILAITVLGLSLASHAQTTPGKVSGNVVDGSTKIVESSTITLVRAKDSSVAKISVADKNGHFEFENVSEGKYMVTVTAVGHNKGYSESFDITAEKNSVQLKTIELVPQAKSMTAVTVVSKKPLIEQKIDRTVVNVEASITNVGASALEVLEKSPGVTVDKDGNISLKGKQGVQIYIDGRPAYLSGADLANMLRNMSASQLEQIEIMTNPPAKFDAAGNSGVINIKTKKNKQFGYNGSVSLGYTQGKYPRFNDGVNFNYRTGKFNIFTNVSHNYNKRAETLLITRNFRDMTTKDIKSSFDQAAHMINENSFYSGKIGIDYNASKRTTLGAVINGFTNPRTWLSKNQTQILDPNGSLRSTTSADSRNENAWKNFSANFNLRHEFDSTGQEITSDFDYIRYNSREKNSLISSYFDNAGNPSQTPDTLLGALPQNIAIYSGKIDYTLPLKKSGKFEAGLKTSFVKTDNDASYTNMVQSYQQLDSARYNHFIYDENINAAYVNFSKELSKKFSAQLGLRLENTVSNGHSTGYEFDTVANKFAWTDKRFERNYTQLFPTAYFQYTLNEKNQVSINYGRRIERPDYEDLNPFQHFIDRYTYQQGNPNLKPQFAHNVELTHTYKGFLNTTINYTTTKDIIQEVLEQNELKNETYIKKANIAKLHQYGLAVSAYKEIKKWWSGNVYMNVYNNQFEGVVNNTDIKVATTTFVFNAQSQFKFGKTWGAEVSGFYRTKGLEGVIFIKPMGMMNFGVSKQIMKGKGSLRFNVRDVFAMQKFNGYSRYSNVDAKFTDISDSRAASLNFTWRFNKGKLKAGNQRKSGGASEEQNRVKAGGGN
jgi:iron complex outermembrane receptor protein